MLRVTQLIAKLKRNDFARDSLLLMLGTIAAQVVMVGSIPILSRLYSPADFGTLAVFMAVASITAIIVTLRYEAAILLPKQDDMARLLLNLSLGLALVLGLLLVVMAWIIPADWAAVAGLSVLGDWLPGAVVTGVGLAVFGAAMIWLNRARAYVLMAKLRVIQSLLVVAFAVFFGVYGFRDGLLAAQLISVLGLMFLVIRHFSGVGLHSTEEFQGAMKEYRSAPMYLLPTALLDTLTLQLPVLLIVSWFDNHAAGQFSVAWKVLAMPISLIGSAVGQVFLQRFSMCWPDAVSARYLLVRTWLLLALVGFIPTTILWLFGEELFVFGLGDSWAHGGRISEILAPMLFVMLISSPTSGTYLVLGLQRYSLLFGVISLVCRPASLAIGFVTGRLEDGLMALVITEIAQVLFYQLLAYRKIGASI